MDFACFAGFQGTFWSFMKPTSNQDTQLPFLMTVIQHLLRASFEGLEIRWAISYMSFYQKSHHKSIILWIVSM